MPSNNTLRGTANIDPFSNNTETITPTINIDSKPRLLPLKYNLSFLYSILYNNRDGRYKKI